MKVENGLVVGAEVVIDVDYDCLLAPLMRKWGIGFSDERTKSFFICYPPKRKGGIVRHRVIPITPASVDHSIFTPRRAYEDVIEMGFKPLTLRQLIFLAGKKGVSRAVALEERFISSPCIDGGKSVCFSIVKEGIHGAKKLKVLWADAPVPRKFKIYGVKVT